jgi:hypothetical protein
MEEVKQETKTSEGYMLIYDAFKELQIIKKIIREHTTYKEGEIGVTFENHYAFGEDLIKVIKYIDVEFYNELKQQGVGQK